MSHVTDHLPFRARAAFRQRFAGFQTLDAPLQVGEGAVFLCERRAWQDYVGPLGSVGQERIADHQKFQVV